MDKRLFSKSDEETIDVVSRGVDDLRRLGATVVDPGPEGALFQPCINKYAPAVLDTLFTRQVPTLFPVDAAGTPTTDQIATLVDMARDPLNVPNAITIRDFGGAAAEGEGRYMRELYVRNRGDAAIQTARDMQTKVHPIIDPQFTAVTRNGAGGARTAGAGANDGTQLRMAERMQQRFAFQQTILQCMAELRVDALVYPTMNIPPQKIQQPDEPTVNNRGVYHWTVFGREGFPTMTVPAGFTTQVYDRVLDSSSPDGTRLVGPTPARLPVGLDIAARPFDEPTMLRIASAYTAATKHRTPPPEFGPLPDTTMTDGGSK
jgi:Asp-tRNA(Asn)/Glu-tRNA(Gln) amidotransferase A subunit family amidase